MCNNCNAGVILHDLGLQFNSPTVNLFFYNDHFFKFCENLIYYLNQELYECKKPIYKPMTSYPICNLGTGDNIIELHFLHYRDFKEAKDSWERRKKRINLDNLYIMWTFFDKTDEKLLKRFDNLNFKNKVAFVEKEFPNYKSAFHIKGYENTGLGVLTEYIGISGKRKIDQFNYVKWFNTGEF